MNKDKEIELIRKRNFALTKELENLKEDILFSDRPKSGTSKEAQEIINDLERVKIEWRNTLDELNEKKEECDKLIENIKQAKFILQETLEGLTARIQK